MAHAYVDGGAPESLVADLGKRWELERISLRRWPAASSVQSLIEVCLELAVPADDVVALAVELSPRAYEVSGERGWATPLAAQQSARWVAACTIVDGDWWLEHSAPERLGDPCVNAVAERISVTASPAIEGGAVRVRLRRTNGEELFAERTSAPGDPERPLSRAEVEAKLSRASSGVVRA
jgi:2-methylcitrate dehydratase PrpD